MRYSISRRKVLKLSAALPLCALEAKSRQPAIPSPSIAPTRAVAVNGSLPQVVELDGLWDFTYDPEPPEKDGRGQAMPALPAEKSFVAKMPVPGYWDDHLALLRTAPFWSLARFNPLYRKLEFPLGDDPPEAMLPYLVGVGWYRKVFDAPREWGERLVTLQVGGARVEAWVWLNGNRRALRAL